jgi:hypothetical protein
MLRGAHVRTASHAGDPAVTVVVTAPRPFQASHVANVLATEIVAADRGIDRRSLARRIKRLTTLASRLHGDRRSEAMRELRLARARQVTDADVHASGYAIQVSGPAPLRAAAVGGLIGALLGAALFAVSRRVTRLRRPV